MSELVTIKTSRAKPGVLARMAQALRSYWTGSFTLKDPALNAAFSLGGRTLAGPTVNEATAFTCAAFWDGVNQISSDVAKQPLELRIRRNDGGSEPYTASPVYRLLKHSANPYTRAMVFRRTLTMHALVYGNGYAEIVRNQYGQPSALWVLEPWRVKPQYEGKLLRYIIDGNERAPFMPSDILHLQGPGESGVMGYNLVNVAREALGLSLASQQFAAAFFGNGTRFGGVLSTEAELTDEDKAGVLASIEALHKSADKAFRLLVLGSGYKFMESGVKPSDAQMTEIRQMQVVEVARFLNMPPHKLKELSRSTNNNIEHQDLEYYKGPILTWDTLWEEELNAKLVSPLEYGRQFFKHNANVFLRGDIKSRYEAFGIARDKGIINADEWRELEDMNPQPGGQGKLYLVQSAQIPVDQLHEFVQAQIDKTNQEAKPDASQQQVDIANARAERAEQLAADAQVTAQAAREALVAADATGKATVEQLATLSANYNKAAETAANLTVLASELRERVDLVQAAKDVSDEMRVKAEAAKEKAEREAQAAHERAETAEHLWKQAEQALDELRAQEAVARADVEAATQLVAEAEARALQAGVDKDAEAAAKAEAERMLAEAQAALEAIRADRDFYEQRVMMVASEAERTADELRQKLAAVEAFVAAGQVALQEASSARAEAEKAWQAAEAERDAFKAQVEDLTVKGMAEAEMREDAQRLLADIKHSERERLTNTIAAHRALIVDAMGRMTRREVEKAKRNQATPEKLRSWLKTVDALHAEVCEEALLPAVRAHLAWKGSGEDPHAATSLLVQEHLMALRDRLLAVADVSPDDYHATLAKTLERWEREQPERVADELMRESIAYLRTLE